MYSFIVNPITNQKVSITSFAGKKILRNYLNVLKGGSGAGGEFEVIRDSVLSDSTFGELKVFLPYCEMAESGLQKHHIRIKMEDDGWTEYVINEFVSRDNIIEVRNDKISLLALEKVNARMLEGFTLVDTVEESSSLGGEGEEIRHHLDGAATKETIPTQSEIFGDALVITGEDIDIEYSNLL